MTMTPTELRGYAQDADDLGCTQVPISPGTLRSLAGRIEALENSVHNLNWALGTPGYEQMATPEEQAEHEAACARTDDLLERLAENKRQHDAMVKDAKRYRLLRDLLAVEDIHAAFTNRMGVDEAESLKCDAAVDECMAEDGSSDA